MRTPFCIAFLCTFVLSVSAFAQEGAPLQTTVIDAATLAAMLRENTGDNPLRVVDSPAGQYGVFLLTTEPRPAPADGVVNGAHHSAIAEVYHVVEGTGVFATGGIMQNPVDVPTDTPRYTRAGPGASGTLQGAQLVDYAPGTIFIVPPGVPHNATYAVTSKTTFLIYRVDPQRVLPAH